ncbi:bifunctional adenosylcobinamide kinase/adenosylcobinamide-phosphate guanylyltransferase [Gephyromycinifex aptenodytis]|uniref:bifunctional adenosylcobinamide kinase/adenosylcobinamide-phosphate guanylyltransferase n=1 Tax=Gephyromycinifex aptenodytis TaxID=2716227 RepID=UPI00144766B6|nr:bifunctional adenosylcobinamide kinase/adenosylcobinamide-phosphate guanylyltransferase [Gephyromycinifex aptenodytis]
MSRILVLGGVRSGKSELAEQLVAHREGVRYIAPGPVPDEHDTEWAARVAAHRLRRPASWTTHETGDVAGVLRQGSTPALVDCLGTWLTRVVDDAHAWDDLAGAARVLAEARADLVAALGETDASVVLVSNEVGLGVVPSSASGRFFRDELGRTNRAVADACDEVLLVVAGRVLDLTACPSIEAAARARALT